MGGFADDGGHGVADLGPECDFYHGKGPAPPCWEESRIITLIASSNSPPLHPAGASCSSPSLPIIVKQTPAEPDAR